MLLALSLVFVMITYFLGFHAARAVFLPMSVVVFGTIWAVGLMGIFGFPLTVVSIVTPPIVLTLGSSYSIHILNSYYRKAKAHQGETDPMWIADAVSDVNNTIFLASSTTVAGLLSLLATTLTQTRQFAISTSFGIIACALLSLFYLPAALAMMKNPKTGISDKVNGGFFSRCMEKLARAVTDMRLSSRADNARVAQMMIGSCDAALERLAGLLSKYSQADESAKECVKKLVLTEQEYRLKLKNVN